MNKELEHRNKPFLKKNDKPSLPPKEQLNVISQFFLNSPNERNSVYEMEAKFGTRGIKRITKIDYDNVVKKLKSLGFYCENERGSHSLKIQPEFIDARTGQMKTSSDIDRFRVEIQGIPSIQEYCKTNSLNVVNELNSFSVTILKKMDVRVGVSEDSDNIISSANFDDFNFRVSLKKEENVNKKGKLALELFENWNRSKKNFRYLNRVSFKHSDFPFQIDLSIVKSSTKNERGWMIQTYNVDESNVFKNKEDYEIEIEALPSARQVYKTPEELSSNMYKVVKYILCGLQKTNYPISYNEQKETLFHYHRLLFEDDYKKTDERYVPPKYVSTSDFIGPSLVTLGLQNIAPPSSNIIVPNITEPYAYCVTDKADGDRHLLYVNNTGKIYLISMNMNVLFTGAITNEERCFNSVVDGELILHNKKDQFINTFAAFDIYYINKIDVRARPFVRAGPKEDKYFEEGCRLPMLQEFIKILKPISVLFKESAQTTAISKAVDKYRSANSSPINIIGKKFYPLFDTVTEGEAIALSKFNIFEANNYLLKKIGDNGFEYEIDGLIFTPTLLGVGGNKFLEAGPKKKQTWPYCFKWKPSIATKIFPHSYNTIDFLVITKKGSDGSDVITPIFEKGVNVHEATQYNQYKTLILAVGFDTAKHGYVNPCQDLLEDKFTEPKDIDDETGYKPKQFFPSNPFDAQAGLCNVMLELDNNGSYQMFTEERDVFEDQTVVEFRYDISKPGLWKWIPMRIRYDKTADFRANNGVGANDYNTANNNWHTIHNPVTEKMIATGEDIPGIEVSDDVYYNSVTNDKLTQRMRDFHNLYVKKTLIQGVSRNGNILIDFACGKAGDLPKWIAAKLSFVFGIDISKDNIENRLNGACARYLNYKKTTSVMPYALFINGNSALNIRSGTNMFNDKANEIVNVVFGNATSKTLGPAVSRQQGKGQNGFDISSCQFAMHYMFENKRTFYNFIRNVAECTRLNGYFIATCYDGRALFNMLKNKDEGETKEIYVEEKKVWSVTKLYDAATFEDNESSLGYKIDVYQDSINQTLTEYLVNFDFLTSTMDKYGFSLVTREEARYMGLPEGSGMFSELYYSMIGELKRDPKKENDYKEAAQMRDYEKTISFLNRFFVYKKTSTRNAEKLTKVLLEQLPDEEVLEEAGTLLARESVKKAEDFVKPKAKKLREKIQLREATEALEEQNADTNKAKAASAKTKTKKAKLELVEDNDVPEVVESAPNDKKAKKTRKTKLVDFEIVEEK
jgi:hypothetical protein